LEGANDVLVLRLPGGPFRWKRHAMALPRFTLSGERSWSCESVTNANVNVTVCV